MSSRPVYSTQSGRLCPGCACPVDSCSCRTRIPETFADGIVRIRRETKGRRGKAVTVISGLGGDSATLARMTSELKKHCGTGGSITDNTVEIQGDKRQQVKTWLEKQGFTVKLSGG